MIRQLLALIFLLGALTPAADAEGGYKVESVGALTAGNFSEPVRGALEDKGLRVVGENGKTLAEVWLRKELPTAKAEVAGATFGQIPEGAFVGVINFPGAVSDYRGQAIKAGYYTLRYALILVDGNHLGVSPSRDFVLLLPASEDKDPSAQLKPEEMMRLSRLAAGTNHPSPWSLVTVASSDGLPKVIKTEEEHVVLQIKLPAKPGAIPVGLVLVGKTEG